jgi:hypothetical protein
MNPRMRTLLITSLSTGIIRLAVARTRPVLFEHLVMSFDTLPGNSSSSGDHGTSKF